MIFRKYEFLTKEEADEKIEALGDHNNSIVKLGHIVLIEGDEDTAPVISEKYHVDILWSDIPNEDWTYYEVWCSPVGVHIFANNAAVREWTERCKEIHPEYFPEEEKLI